MAARAEAMTTTYPQKITFGELRKSGVREVLVIAEIIAADVRPASKQSDRV